MNKKILTLIFIFFLAGCSGGESTSEKGFAPGLDPIPEIFQIEQVTAADAQLSISWLNSKYATKYKLYYKVTTDSNYSEIDSVSSPYILTGLTNGLTYDIKIQALNERGDIYSSPTQGMPQAQASLAKVKMLEQVHSSIQNQVTTRSYKVSGTLQLGVGSKLKVTTSPRGYQLYLSSQSNILTGGQNE